MALTYDQLKNLKITDPGAKELVSQLSYVPVETLGLRGGEVFNEQLQNTIRQINEGATQSQTASDIATLSTYQTPESKQSQEYLSLQSSIQKQLDEQRNRFESAGLSYESTPFAKLQEQFQGGITPPEFGNAGPVGTKQQTSSFTTNDFASSFQQQFGRVPTQAELQQAISGRSQGQTKEQILGTFGTATAQVPTYAGGNQVTPSIVDFLNSVGQPSDFATRAKIAAQNGITNYTGTAEQNTQLLNKLRSTPQAPSSGLTPESFNKAISTTLPGGIEPTTSIERAIVNSANSTLQDIIQQLTPPETALDKQQQTLLDNMASLTGEAANKAADQLTLEQSSGLPELRQQFAEINAKMLSKMAEYDALNADLEGKPITMNSIIGSQAQVTRVKAAEMGLLQAQALGLQGQIETAQSTVDRAIDLKYSTIEAKLDVYQAQLNALQPELNKQEQVQAAAQQVLLDRQKQAIADQKAQEQNIQNVMLQYIQDGGTDTNVMDQISNATSYTDAIKIYGENSVRKEPDLQILGTDSLGYDIRGYWDVTKGDFVTVNANGTTSTGLDSVDVPSYITDAISVVTGSNKLTKDQKNSFVQAMQSGQDPFTVLKNQAKDIMGQTLATDLSKLETAKSQMLSLQTLIDEYYRNDGETNIFVGNLEAVQNKLGTVNDPKLVEIATSIQAALQQYRNAISGTAYSEQEGRDIASVFPGINKTEGLNDAIIQGRLNSFDSSIDSMYRGSLGSVYDTVKGVSQLQSIDTSNLKPIVQSFNSIGDLLSQHPEYKDLATAVGNVYPNAEPNQLMQIISSYGGDFNSPLSMGGNGSDVSGIKNQTKVSTIIGNGVATGIEAGSKYWKYGLDLALAGGRGAPVKAPASGKVISAKKDGNWGNSVKIQLADGRVVRLSHLDNINVKVGQTIPAGTVVGGQGNTGKTYGKTGIHVDVTIYDKNGKPLSSKQVASLLNTKVA